MGNITAKLVKDLRDKTGAGMMDCKKALNETEGNLDKALDVVAQEATRCGAAYVNQRWLGGMLTNCLLYTSDAADE